MADKSRRTWISIAASFGSLIICAVLVFVFLEVMNITPSGYDVWGHVYKAELMYKSLCRGELYPLFDLNWYNGMETFRYWGPASYYLYAFAYLLAGGSMIRAYHMFVTILYFAGGIPWIIMGIKSDRKVRGTLIGILWFMLAENVHIVFAFGNVPQMVTTMLTPYVILFLWMFVYRRSKAAGAGLVIVMLLSTLSHLMVTAIIGVSAFLYFLMELIYTREDIARRIKALFLMVSGIMLGGLWFVPALTGGMLSSSDSGSGVAEVLVTPLIKSLDPTERFATHSAYFYFGLAFLILAVFALIASTQKNKTGYIFLLFVLILTTPSAYEIVSRLPFSGLFWAERFTPCAYGFFLLAFMGWESIRKRYEAVFTGILILDTLPFLCIYLNFAGTYEITISDLDRLNSITEVRSTVMDMSTYGPYPSYAVPAAGKEYTYGWAWQGALTSDNIMLMNESLEKQRYDYMFDRCVEMGDDAVLVRAELVPAWERKNLVVAADRSGYEFAGESDTGIFFKLRDLPDTGRFGTVTTYKGLSVGIYSAAMTTAYPAFTAGKSNYIDDYASEYLKSFETIFLTGFEYRSKQAAETLLKEVSNAGTRIIIDAAHMPTDPISNEENFLGVTASTIRFANRYPTLFYKGVKYNAGDFSAENSDFGTKYITGVNNATGYFNAGDKRLAFLGYNNDSPDILFLGINVVYAATDTDDKVLYDLVSGLFRIDRTDLPERTMVPLEVTADDGGMVIKTDADNVNTSIASAKMFKSERKLRTNENLLTVDSGTTVIEYTYPEFNKGLIVSIAGILMLAGYVIIFSRKTSISQTGG